MRLLKIIWVVYLFACFIACLPNAENNSGEDEIAENQTQTDHLVNSSSIKNFKKAISQNFNLQTDTLPYRTLKNSDFIFFEGYKVSDKSSSEVVEIQFFGFDTQVVCQKEFQQFLNSLGDMQKIKPGKKMKYIKSSPIFSIQNEQSLILLKYDCEINLEVQKINDLKMSLKNNFSTINSKILDVECGGPVNWL